MVGKTIGRYQIEKEIGRGGMARVYLAQDPNFNRSVAIKVLAPQYSAHDTIRARFLREAKTIAALEHAAIVPVYDFGEEDNQPYLVMRHMSGGSLAERLAEGTMSLEEATTIILRMCAALDAAHARGVVHRDIKPGNILFDSHGEAYLSDFGIAKLSDASAQLTGKAFIGTPAYFSPEQAERSAEIDGRTDVYALGVVLFEMLSGNKPFDADTPLGIVMQHINEPVPAIHDIKSSLPDEVQHILEKAMHKQPEQRYQTPDELAAVLRKLLKETGAITPEETSPEPVVEFPETIVEEAPAAPLPPQPLSTPASRRIPGGCWIAGAFGLVAIGIIVLGGAGLLAFNNRTTSTPIPIIAEELPAEEVTALAVQAQADIETQQAVEAAVVTGETEQTVNTPESIARQIVAEAQANPPAIELAQAVITMQSNNLIDFFDTGYTQPDFVLEAVFINPYDTSLGSWDYGIGFRSQNLEEQMQLVIESDATWYSNFRQGENLIVIAQDRVRNALNLGAGGRNHIVLVAKGSTGYFFLNDQFIAELNLSSLTASGEVFFGSGFYSRNELAGQTTVISDIKIWELP